MNSQHASTVGLVELPSLGLISMKGEQETVVSAETHEYPLISKQILLSSLRTAGFAAELVNLKQGDCREEYGKVTWGGTEYTKVYLGTRIQDIDPTLYAIWGITSNFAQEREIARLTIQHLAGKGRPVVVGGSDAVAEPQFYLAAGAAAVVLDKTGGANAPVMDYVLGKSPRKPLSGVILANGGQAPQRTQHPLHPQDWPIPEQSVIRQCLGTRYRKLSLPEDRIKLGSIITDIGCERRCDFCQTPTYRIGYRAMSGDRVLQWLEAQKQAGAKSILHCSDQFLGRILRKGGRNEILDIMEGIRELGLAVFWSNGLELKKTTLGRGINRDSQTDMTPDEELISSLWGWDGKNGCYLAFVPAERPLLGQENYSKLMPWEEHCRIVRRIAHAGVPNIRYGVIIGFEDDNDDSLKRLEEAILKLYEDVININPLIDFHVQPQALLPIPGTKQWDIVNNSGLLRTNDPSLIGNFWTSAVDTRYLSCEQIAAWQVRLARIGDSSCSEFLM